MTALALVLIVGATVRVTRLVQADSILDGPRDWFVRVTHADDHKWGELLRCAWCLSVWVGALVAWSWVEWGERTWWQCAAAVALASHVAGTMAEVVERLEEG